MQSTLPLTVIVTGANRGIGNDLAKIMARNLPSGSKLVLTTRLSPEDNLKLEDALSSLFEDK
jgi:NAD(P)-dependent dehydrogenase (short-subunit alcohol dehydrogenase family)